MDACLLLSTYREVLGGGGADLVDVEVASRLTRVRHVTGDSEACL